MTDGLTSPQIAVFAPGLDSIRRGITEFLEDVTKALEPHLLAIIRAVENYKVCEAMKAAGWLPHDVIPTDLLTGIEAPEEIDRVLTDFFTTNWAAVEAELRKRYESVGLDEEALATMDEVLKAHRHGLYRCVCRTVFPEIDRVARIRYYRPLGVSYGAGLEKLRDGLGEELSWSDFGTHGIWFLHLFKAMSETCYAPFIADAESNAGSRPIGSGWRSHCPSRQSAWPAATPPS